MELEDLKSFVKWWNICYPFDRWWRQKHGVAFNSLQHREQCLIDMRLEYEEDKAFRELQRELKKKDKYIPGTGNFLNRKSQIMSQEEVDNTFDNLDITKMDKDDSIILK